MKYRIRFTPKAIDSMTAEAHWWAEHHSEAQAWRWYEGFMAAIDTLQDMPTRCAMARESSRVRFDLRELCYGSGSRPTHRALFRIAEGQVVILLIRRHSQRDLDKKDLD